VLTRARATTAVEDNVREAVPIEALPKHPPEPCIAGSLPGPELRRARELRRSADSRLTATKRQYLPTVPAIASAGDYEVFDTSRNQRTGGWWTAGAMVSVPLFTGFLIENQVREANAQKNVADANSLNIEQALTQQVTNAYLDTVTFAQQIKLAEEQVKTAQEPL